MKKMARLVCMSVLVLSMTACGGKGSTESAAPAASTAQTTESQPAENTEGNDTVYETVSLRAAYAEHGRSFAVSDSQGIRLF